MEMPLADIILFIVALIIMLIGLFGTILPLVPGSPMVLIAAGLFALITDFKYFGGNILAILLVLTGLTYLLDWIGTAYGIKKMGGSVFGIIGSIIGMIAGLLIPGVGIVGFIIGAFVGAVVFEMLIGKKSKDAFKAGLGSFIGFIVGGVLKFVIAAVMIGIFFWNVLVT